MTNRIHKYIILTAAILIVLSPLSGFSDSTQESVDSKFLAESLLKVDAWPAGGTNYSEANWKQLCFIAGVIQKSDSGTIIRALREYQGTRATLSMEEINDEAKLYLLMRVLFELPERAPNDPKWSSFGYWITARTEINDDGTINRAWPILWNDGRPRLVSGCIGTQSFARYSAANEFLFFKDRFRFRDLSSFKYGERK